MGSGEDQYRPPVRFPPAGRARRVRCFGYWHWFAVLIFGPMLALCLLIFLPMAVLGALAATRGTLTTGVVTGVYTSSSKGKTYYHLKYVYEIHGVEIEDQDEVDEDVYLRYEKLLGATPEIPEKRQVAIRYFQAGWWTVSHVTGYGAWRSYFSLVIAILIAVGVIYGTWFIARGYFASRWLYVWGEPTAGTVTYAGPDPKEPEGWKMQVWYEFTDPLTHEKCEGITDVNVIQIDRAKVGMAVTVMYDPMKPSRSLAYEFGGFAVRERL
jgi:hypothetical protein